MARSDRSTVLFVIIDRPEDAQVAWHDPNVAGVRDAVRAVDPSLDVRVVTIGDLEGADAAAVNAMWNPLAIFSAGSWTEWLNYGVDPVWRARLDNYMSILRETRIPVHAVCGSHQLVAAAFNGWSAVGHMTDAGDPPLVSDEIAHVPPSGSWPVPRVGEQGTYPIALAEGAVGDPIVTAVGEAASGALAALHHCDEVVDTAGFTLLFTSDLARDAATTGGNQSVMRCEVQGMRLEGADRLLYSTQFHPEMSRFDESSEDDGGFGQAWLRAFFAAARGWWDFRDVSEMLAGGDGGDVGAEVVAGGDSEPGPGRVVAPAQIRCKHGPRPKVRTGCRSTRRPARHERRYAPPERGTGMRAANFRDVPDLFGRQRDPGVLTPVAGHTCRRLRFGRSLVSQWRGSRCNGSRRGNNSGSTPERSADHDPHPHWAETTGEKRR